MFLFVHKQNDQRQLAAGVYQCAGFHTAASDESSHGVDYNRIRNVFLPQIVEDL